MRRRPRTRAKTVLKTLRPKASREATTEAEATPTKATA